MAESVQDKIIKALQEKGLVEEKRLKSVMEDMKRKNEGNIINALLESDVVTDHDLLTILSQVMKIPSVDIARIALDPKVMSLVPEKIVKRYCVVPLSKIGEDNQSNTVSYKMASETH